MDKIVKTKSATSKRHSSISVSIRVKPETKKRLQVDLGRFNKKSHGKRIKVDDLLQRALALVGDEDISELQEASLSNQDRLERLYQEHAKMQTSLTKDQFLGSLLESYASQPPWSTSEM